MTTPQTETVETSSTPHADEVQRQLIEELQKSGITHVLSWMDEWYHKEALAYWRDQVHQSMPRETDGKWNKPKFEQEAAHLRMALCIKHALLTADPARQSTQAGSTHLRRARISAAAELHRALPRDIQEISVEAVRDRLNKLAETQYVANSKSE